MCIHLAASRLIPFRVPSRKSSGSGRAKRCRYTTAGTLSLAGSERIATRGEEKIERKRHCSPAPESLELSRRYQSSHLIISYEYDFPSTPTDSFLYCTIRVHSSIPRCSPVESLVDPLSAPARDPISARVSDCAPISVHTCGARVFDERSEFTNSLGLDCIYYTNVQNCTI